MNAADFAGIDRPEIPFNRLAAVVCGDMEQFTNLSEAIGASLGSKVGEEKSGN